MVCVELFSLTLILCEAILLQPWMDIMKAINHVAYKFQLAPTKRMKTKNTMMLKICEACGSHTVLLLYSARDAFLLSLCIPFICSDLRQSTYALNRSAIFLFFFFMHKVETNCAFCCQHFSIYSFAFSFFMLIKIKSIEKHCQFK